MARRLKVPYPIVLVLAGLIISFLPRMPRVPLDPDIVFVVFLPPLLYASAWWMSWREFRRNAIVIGMLAFGLVGFTVWGSLSSPTTSSPRSTGRQAFCLAQSLQRRMPSPPPRLQSRSAFPGESSTFSRARACSTTQPACWRSR
ncbi:cation:proton antiporter [Tunturiibacter gelidiferens]